MWLQIYQQSEVEINVCICLCQLSAYLVSAKTGMVTQLESAHMSFATATELPTAVVPPL